MWALEYILKQQYPIDFVKPPTLVNVWLVIFRLAVAHDVNMLSHVVIFLSIRFNQGESLFLWQLELYGFGNKHCKDVSI